jgi:benzoate/toluate 1,2-dioxygenase alpha subunit
MQHIFEGNRIYLAHESQIPEKNDFTPTLCYVPLTKPAG